MDIQIPESLAEAQVGGLPSTAFYLPNFISEEESENLLHRIHSVPIRNWKELSKRRLQTWPSPLSQNRLIDSPLPVWLHYPIVERLLSIPILNESSQTNTSLPDPSNHIFLDSPHKAPNHCLINEYKPGEGIMAHEDGPAYYGIVATVSLGAPIVLDIYDKHESGQLEDKPRYRILQEPRSLLITTGSLYTDYLHGIAMSTRDEDLGPDGISNWSMLQEPGKYVHGGYDRQTRISLTFRDVKAVIKPSKLIPGLFGKK